jgi:O-antigen biosynthesis protein
MSMIASVLAFASTMAPSAARRSASLARPAVAPARPSRSARTAQATPRPEVRGKHLFVGDEKFWVKGVTYGTFRPDDTGDQFPDIDQVSLDFALMAEHGVTTVRVYTAPPRWLLDVAQTHGLKVMVGLPWAQHIAFLDHPGMADDIADSVREQARTCATHPALLCFSIGNEIPASIVRWLGPRRVEQFLRRLYDEVKAVDPGALVTYVNFPTTEFLRLPFLDFVSFNVYLEQRPALEAYLARLQNLAGERPLLMAEIGLDSRRNGDEAQAASLAWQVRTAFAEGCVGAMVFAWTDEWYRGGHEIEDWDFGLTTRAREPKPALAVVSQVFSSVPFAADTAWPRVSVIVCTYNGARTIRDTLRALGQLHYPDFEVIVVDDGSTDDVSAIVREYPVRCIRTVNSGLSAARNTGWRAATGEIVAYIDDDAYPDAHWLQYLVYRLTSGEWVGVGGPNIAPPGDGPVAECVANAPGGPVHVLISDVEAEHIPGCNMAFWRYALAAIDGFDPRYRTAGDDVDLCWRLQANGGRIGFHAAAVDWHHRRNSVWTYWKQQRGYGKAEALLEEKWPERYNAAGHLNWSGRLYGKGFVQALPLRRARIYQGTWGSAAFQSIYEPATGTLASLPMMPEWYVVMLLLTTLLAAGFGWAPLRFAVLPLLGVAMVASLVQALLAGQRAAFPGGNIGRRGTRRKQALTAVLHLLQPAARLLGRLEHGLSPWRARGIVRASVAQDTRAASLWSERWYAPEEWVARLETGIRDHGAVVVRGGDFDAWDLRVRGGLLGAVHGVVAAEEHGAGRQLVRFRNRGVVAPIVLASLTFLVVLTTLAVLDAAWPAVAALAALTLALAVRAYRETAHARAVWRSAIAALHRTASEAP